VIRSGARGGLVRGRCLLPGIAGRILDGRMVVAAICGDRDEALPCPAASGSLSGVGHEVHVNRRSVATPEGYFHVAGASAAGE
jgi:hypothetical protein